MIEQKQRAAGPNIFLFFFFSHFLAVGGVKREGLWNGSQRRNQGHKPHPFFLCEALSWQDSGVAAWVYLSLSVHPERKGRAPHAVPVEEPRNLIVSPPHFLRIYLMSHESTWTWPKNLCMEAREVCGNAVCIRCPRARKRFLPAQKMMHHSDPRNPSVDIIHIESKDISTKYEFSCDNCQMQLKGARNKCLPGPQWVWKIMPAPEWCTGKTSKNDAAYCLFYWLLRCCNRHSDHISCQTHTKTAPNICW